MATMTATATAPFGSSKGSMAAPGSTSTDAVTQPSAGQVSAVEAALHLYIDGIVKALRVHKLVPLFLYSRLALLRSLQCLLLNAILLGGVLLTHYVFMPVLQSYATYLGVDAEVNADLVWAVDTTVWLLFNGLWFVPLYIMSFVLTTVWYSDIAAQAYKHCLPAAAAAAKAKAAALKEAAATKPGDKKQQQEKKKKKWALDTGAHFVEAVVNEAPPSPPATVLVLEALYRLLVMLSLMAQVGLVQATSLVVPYVGNIIAFILTSLIYSLYSFEYKWSMQGLTIAERLGRVEQCWVFLLGFGTPFTLATFGFSFYVNASLYALLFPVNIILAAITEPVVLQQWPHPLPMFRIAKRVSIWLLRAIEYVLGTKEVKRRPLRDAAPTSSRRTQ